MIHKPHMEDLAKTLDILMSDLTDEQKAQLDELGRTLDPSKVTASQAMEIVKKTGLDIEKLQKNSRRIRAELLKQNKKPRIGANEICPCQSGKKYKKCCRLKDAKDTQK